jgi:hypothetical protein
VLARAYWRLTFSLLLNYHCWFSKSLEYIAPSWTYWRLHASVKHTICKTNSLQNILEGPRARCCARFSYDGCVFSTSSTYHMFISYLVKCRRKGCMCNGCISFDPDAFESFFIYNLCIRGKRDSDLPNSDWQRYNNAFMPETRPASGLV